MVTGSDKTGNSSLDQVDGNRRSNVVLKEAFQKLQRIVVEYLDIHDVIDELFAAGVLTWRDTQEYNARDSDRLSVRRLLLHLHGSKNPQTFQELRQALLSKLNENKYCWLVDQIDNLCNEIVQSNKVATSDGRGQLQESISPLLTAENDPMQNPEPSLTEYPLSPQQSKSGNDRIPATDSLNVVSSGRGIISGIAIINDELFVLRSPCGQTIEVYDADTLNYKRHVSILAGILMPKNGFIPFITSPWAMGACDADRCMYIGSETRIHRLDLDNDSYHKMWLLRQDFEGYGLSVTQYRTVLVSGQLQSDPDGGFVIEFSPEGGVIRKIEVSARPYFAVLLEKCRKTLIVDRPFAYTRRRTQQMKPETRPLPSKQSGVPSKRMDPYEIKPRADLGDSRVPDLVGRSISLTTAHTLDSPPPPLHRVILANEDGSIARSHGTIPGMGFGCLWEPVQLAIMPTTENDFEIYVTSKNNHRIVVLKSDMSWSRDITIPGLTFPRTICADISRRRLYVGESGLGNAIDNNGRVVVICI